MKYYWQISTILLVMSLGVVGWMAYELNLFSFGILEAAENKDKATDASGNVPPENELVVRARDLASKEALVKEQVSRSEKIISELKQKLAQKEEELKTKSLSSDEQVKSKMVKIEEEHKRKIAQLEEDYKQKLARKDKELKAKEAMIAKIKDNRAETYRSLYEKMEPKQAAKILNDLDINLAGQILGGMKNDKAAEILAKMTSERAKLLTERAVPKRAVASKPKFSEEVKPESNGANP